jgi:hypothetical protein
MTRGILGARVWRAPDFTRDVTAATDQVETRPETESLGVPAPWSPENFAREQIRGLVRQVFFSNAVHTVRQIVFSALERETEVRSICRRVGETLAPEIDGRVAVVGSYPRMISSSEMQREPAPDEDESTPLRQVATRVRGNLWLIPDGARGGDSGLPASWDSFLGEVRREFEYSIVQAPPAGESDEATEMAQAADGIILVLSAQRTRRATACKIKQMLEAAHANILGTVLSDRVFPIPEAIYRRL